MPALGGDRLRNLRARHMPHCLGTCLLKERVRLGLHCKVHGMEVRRACAGKGDTYPDLGCWASRSACCLLWPEVAPNPLGAERLTAGQRPPHSEAEPGHVRKKSDPASGPPLHTVTLLPKSTSARPLPDHAPPGHAPSWPPTTSTSEAFSRSPCSYLDQGSGESRGAG